MKHHNQSNRSNLVLTLKHTGNKDSEDLNSNHHSDVNSDNVVKRKQENINPQKKKLLLPKEKYKAILQYLQETYPKCFTTPPVPVAVGMHKILIDKLADTFLPTEIRKFLKIYTGAKLYRKNIITGASRHNLDGSVSSYVTEVQYSLNINKTKEKKIISYNEVIKFWFDKIKPEQRWIKDTEFDAYITKRFGDVHSKAIKGELKFWRNNALGILAEIIILDQFSRNIFRNTKSAFAYDEIALKIAKEAIEQGYDQELDMHYRVFLYMPFMHSESAIDHKIAVKLFKQKGLEDAYNYELKHQNIIDRFGRYPHRNKILGRESTPEEIAFLQEPDSAF